MIHITLTLNLRITGRVQGVGYRWNVARKARVLSHHRMGAQLAGGSVEAQASGPADVAQALVDWAHRGPELARAVV